MHKLSPPSLSHPEGLGAQEGSGLKAAPGPAALHKKHISLSGERRRWQVWLLVNQNFLSSRPSGRWHVFPRVRSPEGARQGSAAGAGSLGAQPAPLAWPWRPSAVPLSVPRCLGRSRDGFGSTSGLWMFLLRVRMQPALLIPWVERAKHESGSQPSPLLPGLGSSQGHFPLGVSSP